MDMTQVRNQGRATATGFGAGPVLDGQGSRSKRLGHGGLRVFGLAAASVAVLGAMSSMAWASVGETAGKGPAVTVEMGPARAVSAPTNDSAGGSVGLGQALPPEPTEAVVTTAPESHDIEPTSVPVNEEGTAQSAGGTTAMVSSVEDKVVLRTDAVGPVAFGTSVDDTIAALSAMFGAPSEPLVWHDMVVSDENDRPYQAGYVTWGALTVQFFGVDDVPVFNGWKVSGFDAVVDGPSADRFVTDEGLVVGMTVGDVQGLRADAVFGYSEIWQHFESHLEVAGGHYWLSTLDEGPSAVIDWMSSGMITNA